MIKKETTSSLLHLTFSTAHSLQHILCLPWMQTMLWHCAVLLHLKWVPVKDAMTLSQRAGVLTLVTWSHSNRAAILAWLTSRLVLNSLTPIWTKSPLFIQNLILLFFVYISVRSVPEIKNLGFSAALPQLSTHTDCDLYHCNPLSNPLLQHLVSLPKPRKWTLQRDWTLERRLRLAALCTPDQ